MKKLAIFASGSGTNAEKIMRYFAHHTSIEVACVVSNKADAGVLAIAESAHIPTLIIEKEQFFRGDAYVPALKERGIEFIVLAGFLWKIPVPLINAFPGNIINIHPALLPNYGGKGMYGAAVHRAVVEAKEPKSGITIHFVDEHYDHGGHIFQATCELDTDETPESLAKKVQVLEHAHFPRIIEKVVLDTARSVPSH